MTNEMSPIDMFQPTTEDAYKWLQLMNDMIMNGRTIETDEELLLFQTFMLRNPTIPDMDLDRVPLMYDSTVETIQRDFSVLMQKTMYRIFKYKMGIPIPEEVIY